MEDSTKDSERKRKAEHRPMPDNPEGRNLLEKGETQLRGKTKRSLQRKNPSGDHNRNPVKRGRKKKRSWAAKPNHQKTQVQRNTPTKRSESPQEKKI